MTIRDIQRALRIAYTDTSDTRPWVVGFSAGKDSMLLLCLILAAVQNVAPSDRQRKVYVLTNDTRVESPVFQQHVDSTLAKLQDAIEALSWGWCEIVRTNPAEKETFWHMVVGRGYRTPTRHFRWCTDRLKIRPTQLAMKGLATKHADGFVLLLGVRSEESAARAASIAENSAKDAMGITAHASIPKCYVMSPIRDVTLDDLWAWLLQNPPPWGGHHRQLITLYKNASGGECPLVVELSQAPSCGTGDARFGCYVCTVIQKDRSLEGLVDSGYEWLAPFVEFREWLEATATAAENRMTVRRNGTNGAGPIKVEIRKLILERLLALQEDIGIELVSRSEVAAIRDQWIQDECQMALRQVEILHKFNTGEPFFFDTGRMVSEEERTHQRQAKAAWAKEKRSRLRQLISADVVKEMDKVWCNTGWRWHQLSRTGDTVSCTKCGRMTT